MSLLHLVEQDHGVRTTAHGLGELPTLVVAHVSRGRTDQTLNAELLHVLGHVDTHERALVIEQALGQRLGEFGLAHTGGAQEEEAADGLVRIGEARTATAHGRGDGGDGLILADDALMQLAFQAFSLSSSPCIILETGTPVQALTTSAISSEVTCSLRPSPSCCFCASSAASES